MAEGLARRHLPDLYEAHSAGTDPGSVDPRAVEVMKEVGIDISGQHSKSVDDLAGTRFDLVVTLCGDAREACPFYPGESRVEHLGFDDPARTEGTEREVMENFRRVRNGIRDRLIPFLKTLHKDLSKG